MDALHDYSWRMHVSIEYFSILVVSKQSFRRQVFRHKRESLGDMKGSGGEQKIIKKYQMIQTFKDPITWLFSFFFLTQQLCKNLAYEQNLLFEGMGNVTNLDSTLVAVAAGGFASICALVATIFQLYKNGYTAWSILF